MRSPAPTPERAAAEVSPRREARQRLQKRRRCPPGARDAEVAINSADHEPNPPELGIMERELRRIKNARLYLIAASEDTRGHGTTGMARFWKAQRADFLGAVPKR